MPRLVGKLVFFSHKIMAIMTSRQRFSREKLIVYLQLSTKNPKSSSKLVWAVSLDVSEENERLAARLGIVAIL